MPTFVLILTIMHSVTYVPMKTKQACEIAAAAWKADIVKNTVWDASRNSAICVSTQ